MPGGRPKGRTKATIEKERIKQAFKLRVARHARRLFNCQMRAAEGCTVLVKKPKTGGKSLVVTDADEICRFIDGELTEAEQEFYYYDITTDKPNPMAADMLLNRAFGKPVESVELSGPDGGDIAVKEKRALAKQLPDEVVLALAEARRKRREAEGSVH